MVQGCGFYVRLAGHATSQTHSGCETNCLRPSQRRLTTAITSYDSNRTRLMFILYRRSSWIKTQPKKPLGGNRSCVTCCVRNIVTAKKNRLWYKKRCQCQCLRFVVLCSQDITSPMGSTSGTREDIGFCSCLFCPECPIPLN